MFQGFTPKDNFKLEGDLLWMRLRDMIPRGLQMCHGDGGQEWKKILKAKNESPDTFLKNWDIMGVRWDNAELVYHKFQEGIKGIPIKFIYSMRADLEGLFSSQVYHGYLPFSISDRMEDAANTFMERMKRSFREALTIGAFPFDVSQGDDYSTLLDYLGLKPNGNQKAWMAERPKTNVTNQPFYKVMAAQNKEMFNFSTLRPMFNETRRKLSNGIR
jgi:hypothetical protein